MTQRYSFYLLAIIIVLALAACSFPNNNNNNNQGVQNPPPAPALQMAVSADTSAPFNTVGQVINYSYLIMNTGSALLSGPATVTDDKAATTCPAINSVGNLDDNFDPNEVITCTGTYAITQADLDSGSVTNIATATVGEGSSAPASTVVTMTQNKVLTLTMAANPTTYNQLNQTITYTYVILNGGDVTLPGPFTITDDKVTVNCTQPGDGSLPSNKEMSCTATYSITQNDLNATSVTNNASATNGTVTSNTVTTTINKTGSGNTTPPISNLTPGETVQHQVVSGEWLWQIARCYGADPKQVMNANPQFYHHARLMAGMILTIPNVGSRGTIYYPQSCVTIHKVQPGETWESIAAQYSNVDLLLLKTANPGGLFSGKDLKVPVGPYNYP